MKLIEEVRRNGKLIRSRCIREAEAEKLRAQIKNIADYAKEEWLEVIFNNFKNRVRFVDHGGSYVNYFISST